MPSTPANMALVQVKNYENRNPKSCRPAKIFGWVMCMDNVYLHNWLHQSINRTDIFNTTNILSWSSIDWREMIRNLKTVRRPWCMSLTANVLRYLCTWIELELCSKLFSFLFRFYQGLDLAAKPLNKIGLTSSQSTARKRLSRKSPGPELRKTLRSIPPPTNVVGPETVTLFFRCYLDRNHACAIR